MTDPNISYIWGFLQRCNERGWLYRGHRPMTWCARCGTSLSQHEVTATDSYRDVVHTALTVRFRLQDGAREHLLVWTTTPWTLPANVAAAVNPTATYARVETDQAHVIVAADRVEAIFGEHAKVHSTFPGSELVGRPYLTGFDELPVQTRGRAPRGRLGGRRPRRGHRASSTSHPAAARRTSSSGKREGLPVLTPVDDAGAFYDSYGWLHGVHTHEATERIVDHLGKNGWLFHEEAYPHRYPVCWRCGTELIFRVVDEWFISADEVRQPMIDAARTVEWTPSHYGKRMEDWLNNMGDWCISRKRYWGLPLPFYQCPDGHLTVVGSKDELLERATQGVEGLEELHRPWIDPVRIRCAECEDEAERVLRGRRLLARRGHHPVLDARLRARLVPARRLRRGRGRGSDRGRPARQRVLGALVPGRLGLGDARADPALVLLAALHVGRAHGQGALPRGARLREAERRDRPSHAQVVGQRDLVRRRDRGDGRRRDALALRRAAARPEHELRLRPGRHRAPPPAPALEQLPLPLAERGPRGLPSRRRRARARPALRRAARPLAARPRAGARARRARGARPLRDARVRAGLRALLRRPLELVRAQLARALLGRRSDGVRRAAPRARARRPRDRADDAVPRRGAVGGPGRRSARRRGARLGAPRGLPRGRRRAARRGAARRDGRRALGRRAGASGSRRGQAAPAAAVRVGRDRVRGPAGASPASRASPTRSRAS